MRGDPRSWRPRSTSTTPLGSHLHCLVAQVPVRLRAAESGFALFDREAHWRYVSTVLDLVAGDQRFQKLHFLLFPEAAVPAARLDDVLEAVKERFRPNTVTMFGLEHVTLRDYLDTLRRFGDDNRRAIPAVEHDLSAGALPDIPVNWCCVAVKEASGRVRVFFEAKSHPFRAEEFIDKSDDLYRGRHFWWFRAQPAFFHFMVLVCLDYLYRDLYGSNIRRIVDHANQQYFGARRTLDALFVLQCNPKPDHRSYRDVLSGFYGEYLEDTPGRAGHHHRLRQQLQRERDRRTVPDGIRRLLGDPGPAPPAGPGGGAGVHHRRLPGAPVCRLRFGNGTRLYYFNLPLHHELDPRTSHQPLKVHAVLRPEGAGWLPVSGAPFMADLWARPDDG